MPPIERVLLRQIEAKAAQLATYRPLPVEVMRSLHEAVAVAMTYHSNAIEGSTMQIDEVGLALAGERIPGNHTAEEIAETIGHAQAWRLVQDDVTAGNPMRAELIIQIHDLVKPYHAQRGGWRTEQVYIRGAQHMPPPAWDVPRYMDEWMRYVNRQEGHALDQAAKAHAGFETVHPFMDGNGRTGRLLLNWMLLRDGYAPAIIEQTQRLRYLQALIAAQPPGPFDYAPLTQLVAEAVHASLTRYLRQLVPDQGFHEMSMDEAAVRSGISAVRLRELARIGKLEAKRYGKRWVTWPAAIDLYLQTRNRVGKPAQAGEVKIEGSKTEKKIDT